MSPLLQSNLRSTLRHAWQDLQRSARFAGVGLIGYVTQPYWKDARAVFILSTGRTGTKTLARLLGLSEQIDAFHEPHPQLLAERKTARWEIESQPKKYRRIFAWARGAALSRAVRRDQIYAETSARLTFFAPVLARLLPHARFIYVHRAPTAVIRSGMRRGWYVDHPADFARIEPVPGEPAYASWEKWSAFKKTCWYWEAYNRFALDFCQDVAADRVLVLRADTLFNGSAVEEIFAHIGVLPPSTERVEAVLSKKLNAQQQYYFPRAEQWSDEMMATLHAMAGTTMARLGYKVASDALAPNAVESPFD